MKIKGTLFEIGQLIRWCEVTKALDECGSCPFKAQIEAGCGTGVNGTCLEIEEICEVEEDG